MNLSPAAEVYDKLKHAQEVFHRNIDTHIAGFLIQNPDVNPADVELVMAPGPGGKLTFSIEPRELHVPPLMDPDAERKRYDEHIIGPDELEEALTYIRGWNACRDAMMAKAKAVRPADAMVSRLEDSL